MSTRRRVQTSPPALRPDRGSVAVEFAVLAPLALVLLMSVLQAGLWWHTRALCLSAAQHGVHAARTVTGTAGHAHAAATGFLTRAAPLAAQPAVTADVDTRSVTVRVSATAPQVLPIPGLAWRVEQEARASKELFTTPGSQP
ncbi:TadE/TadG family type IV pilus assembly protein [Saccharopolyspora sp. NPDC003762]